MIMSIKNVKEILFKKKASIIFNMKFNTQNTYLYSNFIFTLKWFMNYYPPNNYEYILIEQDINSKIEIPYNLNIKKILLYNPNIYNRGWGYNVAVKHFMNTDVAIFCDSDIILENPENLIKCVNICRSEKKLVSPYDYVTFTSNNERTKILENKTSEITFKSHHPVTISGGIVVVNREEFLEIGGFEEYKIYGGEDRSLDVIFMSKDKFEIIKGYGIHLYHPQNPTKKHQESNLMLKHLKDTYQCSYNILLKPYDFIHSHCKHKNGEELKEHILLKKKYFGNMDLYKNNLKTEINSFPKK